MVKKYTESELLDYIDLYLSGIPYQTLVSQHSLQLSDTIFKRYVNNYRPYGSEGIKY